MAVFREIRCSSACHRVNGRLPFHYDLNIYRGCEHRCQYCYAIYSHQYLHSGQYFDEIFVKTNVAEQLERQLRSPSWKGEVINLGGVTDSYQPAEKQYQLMPRLLRLLIRYRNPCIISTKSDLILRDFSLIEQLASRTFVNIACTVTCMDEAVRQKLEPGGAPSARRLEVLRAFSETRACTGLHLMPIVPYLTDTRENIDAIYAAAKSCGVTYVLPGTLYLRGKTRGMFFEFIQREYPQLYGSLHTLYQKGGAGSAYQDGLYRMVHEIRRQYGVSHDYITPMREGLRSREEPQQLSLFD